jgi:hypothetical protein
MCDTANENSMPGSLPDVRIDDSKENFAWVAGQRPLPTGDVVFQIRPDQTTRSIDAEQRVAAVIAEAAGRVAAAMMAADQRIAASNQLVATRVEEAHQVASAILVRRGRHRMPFA